MPHSEVLQALTRTQEQYSDILAQLKSVTAQATAVQLAATRVETAAELIEVAATRAERAAERATRASETAAQQAETHAARLADEVRQALRRENNAVAKFLDEWARGAAYELDKKYDRITTELKGHLEGLALMVEGIRSAIGSTYDAVTNHGTPARASTRPHDDESFSEVEQATQR